MREGFTTAGSSMRILLVDDEPLLLKSFARYLGGVHGHEILYARNGSEALAQLEAGEAIDLIFCDLRMPDISGVEVHQAVCERHAELCTRFVFLTGGLADEATEQYIRQSGALILGKPVRQVAFDKILADMGGA